MALYFIILKEVVQQWGQGGVGFSYVRAGEGPLQLSVDFYFLIKELLACLKYLHV
jgi:hypothetical protein